MKQTNITPEIAKDMYQSGIDSLKQLAVLNYPELFCEQKKWEDFGEVSGAWINGSYGGCSIVSYGMSKATSDNRDVHPTTKEAESALALSQLCQWRDKVNGEPFSNWVNWSDNQEKYCIEIYNNVINGDTYYNLFHDLAFKTREIRDQFMKDHKDLLEVWASKSRK
jgi:hypothetical protein